MSKNGLVLSIVLFVIAFALDRIHKFMQVSWDCVGHTCVEFLGTYHPETMVGWRGGEIVPVTGFFDYVLIWNTGISYGLLGSLPVWVIGALMAVALVALCVWWWRSTSALVRGGLALCIGGALSNALDRLLYGAVADFFHFHWQDWSFYIFNVADAMITAGVLLLILDVLGIGRAKTVSTTQ
ncbi:MAG: signal peptidase II [Hyphomicrobiales bacterium]|nr:MAG: signal peptidase II [Hyphomicrobiales bacterium]